MSSLLWILLSSVVLALISLIGGLALFLSKNRFDKIINHLVSFSAGALLSGAMIHLLPESFESFQDNYLVGLLVLGGLIIFYIFEQFIHWHHCHRDTGSHVKPVSYLILFADGLHNLMDGLAVGSAFMVDHRLGLASLVAIVSHEIPQELGDFGIMIYSGWTAKKALIFNLMSSLTFLAGGLATYFMSKTIDVTYFLPITAGGFIYIAAVDLLPQVNNKCQTNARLGYFISFLLGIILLVITKIIFNH